MDKRYSQAANQIANDLESMNDNFDFLVSGAAGQTFTQNASSAPVWVDAPHRNLLINGDCRVVQEATAYDLSAAAANAYDVGRVDMWAGAWAGTACTAGSLTFGTGGVSVGIPWAGHFIVFNGMTITGTGQVKLAYRMRAKDARELISQTVSFSAQVYHDVGSAINYTVYVRHADNGADDDFSVVDSIGSSGAQSVASGTWTEIKYENITMPNDCHYGVEIMILAACGAVTAKDFRFTNLQLEFGAFAGPFLHKNYDQQLRDCQVYREYGEDARFYAYNPNVGSADSIGGISPTRRQNTRSRQ